VGVGEGNRIDVARGDTAKDVGVEVGDEGRKGVARGDLVGSVAVGVAAGKAATDVPVGKGMEVGSAGCKP
jgi:hypothetical protein